MGSARRLRIIPLRILLATLSMGNDSVAILTAVPWQESEGDLGPIVLGRVWDTHDTQEALGLPGDLPAPPPMLLQPALRPYAAVVPLFLRAAVGAHSFALRDHLDGLSDSEKESRMRQRQQSATAIERALAPLLARLRWLDNRSDLPPNVLPDFIAKMSPHGQYAWFNECQLAVGLSAALGRSAAVEVAPYMGLLRRGHLGRMDFAPAQDDQACADAKRRRSSTTEVRVHTLTSLETIVRGALARSRSRVPIEAFPPALQDPIGFDIWQQTCAARVPRRPGPVDQDRFAPLVNVARAWDIEPTDAQVQTPQLLCGGLAREAIGRGMQRGIALSPSGERLGVPFVAPEERRAAETVCYDSDPSRPFERAGKTSTLIALSDAFDNAVGSERFNASEPAVKDFKSALVNVMGQANATYGVRRGSSAREPRDVGTRASLAALALRSGVALEPHDLSDAAHACAAVMPTLALAP